MSALEVINSIKTMSVEDREKIKLALQDLEKNSPVNTPTFDEALDTVFSKHKTLLQELAR